MKKRHLFIQPRGKRQEEKLLNLIDKDGTLDIKQNIIDFIVENSELDLKSLDVREFGLYMNNKEIRFHPPDIIWHNDYKGIPLYNRITENLFTKQELENIRDLFIQYFNESHNISLKCKFVSIDDLIKIPFK